MREFLKSAPWGASKAEEQVRLTVEEMLSRIEQGGVSTIREYSRTLDGWDPPSFLVSEEAVARASARLSPALKDHIAFAQANVRAFAEAQLATMSELNVEIHPGVTLGHRHIPVQQVGAYVPGGRYPMLASSFMTILVAKVAGVERVVAVSPPWEGDGIHPAVLHSMVTSGADEIVCLGGVQALAALAFGIDGVKPVDMLVGAGNAYVAEAKRQLFGRVGIDLLAGPTEILIIADDSAEPELLAMDLLGQAEHGPTSPCVLVSTSKRVAQETLEAVTVLLRGWPTAEVAAQAWESYGSVVVVGGADEAVAFANELAPEHLEVHVADDLLDGYFQALVNYGSLFLGSRATVTYGDKAVGTNHVLPTRGAARFTGGLWVGKFLKTVTYQQLTDQGTRAIAPAATAIANEERLAGHAITSQIRLDRLPPK